MRLFKDGPKVRNTKARLDCQYYVVITCLMEHKKKHYIETLTLHKLELKRIGVEINQIEIEASVVFYANIIEEDVMCLTKCLCICIVSRITCI